MDPERPLKPEPGSEKPSPGSSMPGAGAAAGMGLQFAISVLLFLLAGQWLDRKLGTGGIVTILAAFLGFGGTMYSLIRTLNKKDGGDR